MKPHRKSNGVLRRKFIKNIKKEKTIVIDEDIKEQILDIFDKVIYRNNHKDGCIGLDAIDFEVVLKGSNLEDAKEFSVKEIDSLKPYVMDIFSTTLSGDVYQIFFKNKPTEFYILCEWTGWPETAEEVDRFRYDDSCEAKKSNEFKNKERILDNSLKKQKD